MLSGRQVKDKNLPSKERNLLEWAMPYHNSKRKVFEVLDTRIAGQYTISAAQQAFNLAIKCLLADPRLRPNMQEVVNILEQLYDSNDKLAVDASMGS